MNQRPPISRRHLLLGTAAAFGVPAVLAGCGSGSPAPAPGGTGGDLGTVTIGSNASDEIPKKTLETVVKGFTQATTKINTVDHNTFQENINRYLRGTPDDVFTWFAGYRMQFFAEQGLAVDISDVWQEIGGNYTQAFKDQSTGVDGKQYFIPFTYYPWAVFYRRSLWQDKGYEPPATLDEFTALARKMKADGLIPIAFADKDGWPAMGTFDILNLRTNGYDFHISLMAGKESWTDPKVKQVFETWRGLMQYHQPAALGRTWQEAGQSLAQKKTGMYLLGMFVAQQFPEADRDDLDFFTFPEINPAYGTDSIDAPIDGYMISAKARNADGAKALLKHFAQPSSQNIATGLDPGTLAAGSKADTSGYSALQKRGAELVSKATHIAQFLDRDTRPDFASTVMIPSLQSFVSEPEQIDPLLASIEKQKANIFR
ncbi:ABC transporter substrate-binding protein [Nonomuraea gerenzanensis]|uniref:Putative ABC transporter solute-binding protein n=1 Tax=Nonomuraea gerenzanensis TaxID=93944 RepID=A0A1M4E6X7_9ACTN|nr:ABC transporter substrate-binding protein [Nonomuraea gerenzanensis]UBU16778.1 ABC transporter substrate-binding protein [Nonomuraea gerenzanensis]SBO94488.1 putative ABC transporter solute-binding protein [Nonomuraea gerenzanensis]